MAGEQQLYVLYFQEQGLAEAELEADVRKSLRMMLYSASGDAPPEKGGGFYSTNQKHFWTVSLNRSSFRVG